MNVTFCVAFSLTEANKGHPEDPLRQIKKELKKQKDFSSVTHCGKLDILPQCAIRIFAESTNKILSQDKLILQVEVE